MSTMLSPLKTASTRYQGLIVDSNPDLKHETPRCSDRGVSVGTKPTVAHHQIEQSRQYQLPV